MKRILLSLFCVLTAVFAGMAQNIVGATTATPDVDLADGAQKVEITLSVDFTSWSWGGYTVKGDAQLLESQDDTNGIPCAIEKGTYPYNGVPTIYITIPETTPNGAYYLNFPEGCFTYSTSKNANWTSSAPMFTITGGGGEAPDYSEYFVGAEVAPYPSATVAINGCYIYFPALKDTDLNITGDKTKITIGDRPVAYFTLDTYEGYPAYNCSLKGDDAITEPGDYEVFAAAGAFRIGETLSPEITGKLTLAEPVKPELTYDAYPSDDVIGFGETIEVQFPGTIAINDRELIKGIIDGVGVLNFEKGESSLFFQIPFSWAKEGEFPVTITLEEGAISCKLSEDETIENQLIEVEKTVKREYLESTVDPAPGNVEKMPTEINVTFNDVYFVFPIGETYDDYEGYQEAAVLTKDNVEVGKYNVVLNDNWDGFSVKIEGEFADGIYTLTIPEVLFGTEYYISVNPEYKLNYTVGDPLGVEAISADADSYTVVDCAGRVVVRNGSVEATRSLDKGLYIVNGKKVVIR